MPIKVRERSGLGRTLGAALAGTRNAGRGVTDARGVLSAVAAGGTDDGVTPGGEMPSSVCLRSGLGRAPGAPATTGGGAAEDGAGAAAGVAWGSAPQSVSISSVEGGTEGSALGVGGSLRAGRAGTDEVRPWARARSPSSLVTTLLRSHTVQVRSSRAGQKAPDEQPGRLEPFRLGAIRPPQAGGDARIRTFGSVNSSTAKRTPSRPIPESFMPPYG